MLKPRTHAQSKDSGNSEHPTDKIRFVIMYRTQDGRAKRYGTLGFRTREEATRSLDRASVGSEVRDTAWIAEKHQTSHQ